MKRHSKHTIYNPYTDINVVPLVDLTFNLLIIFMLVTPLLETSINLKLPQATSGEVVDSPRTRVVSVERNGRIFLDDVPIGHDKLLAQIHKAVERLFKVHVEKVRTANYLGKLRRVGRNVGRRPGWKKAYVTLREGERIDFFEAV